MSPALHDLIIEGYSEYTLVRVLEDLGNLPKWQQSREWEAERIAAIKRKLNIA